MIASVALWPWVVLAARHELPIEQLADLIGVSVADLRDPGARFSQATANHVAELVLQRVGPSAPLEAALTMEAGQFALIELLARTSPTAGEGLALGCQYFSLIHSGVQLTHEIRSDGSHRMLLVLSDSEPINSAMVEYTFAVWLVGLRRETQHAAIEPTEVWFQHRAPDNLGAAFESVFGPNLRFSMPCHHVVISPQTAALPLMRHNSGVNAEAQRAASDLTRG